MSSSRSRKQNRGIAQWLIPLGAATLFLCICSFAATNLVQRAVDAVSTILNSGETQSGTTAAVWDSDSATLTIAVSPIMESTLQVQVERFNGQDRRTSDGQLMRVELLPLDPEEIAESALNRPRFQALSPDSSLWLNQIDLQWAEIYPPDVDGIAPRRVAEVVRYAVSPIVIAAWEDVARELGWPDRPVGWAEIQQRAKADPDFRWNHPSTRHAAGLLATLAEFYAGAGITRGLTAEIAVQESVIDYVREVEATVRFYGEGEERILERIEVEGRDFLDAFVAQEQTLIRWNQSAAQDDRLVAIYPAEGTLWVDHPLALLELGREGGPHVTANQRGVFAAFSEFLLSEESQRAFLEAGYRPADLDIDLTGPGSPFAGSDAVDWRQPQTVLQIPPAPVVEVVQNVWWYTKRPTNVYLVVDTSGSMEGEKLERTRRALLSFIEQIRGDRDRVGLVEFGSGVKHFEPLRQMDESGRARLVELIEGLDSSGYTSLLDAVWVAQNDLKVVNDPDAINALVVMTDGQENDSYYRFSDLQQAFSDQQFPVVLFTIAFGSDAETDLLQELARIGGGEFRRADETDIEELYRILSTYF